MNASEDSLADVWRQSPSATPWGRFGEGLKTPWWGIRFLWRRPALWSFAVIPVVMNIFITTLVLGALIGAAMFMMNYVHPWFNSAEGWTGWFWWAIEIGVVLLSIVVCGMMAFLTWKILTGFLCGMSYGKLASAVERDLGLDETETRSLTFAYEMVDTGIGVGLLLGANMGFLAIGVIPLIGPLVASLGMGWFGWFLLGVDHLSYPLAVRGQRRIEHFRFGRKHHSHTLGVGAVQSVCQLIPIVGAIPVTAGVVGCVLLHRRLTNHSHSE